MPRLQFVKTFRIFSFGLLFLTIKSHAQLTCADLFKNQKFTAPNLIGRADSRWFESSLLENMLNALNEEASAGVNFKVEITLMINLKKTTREDTKDALLRDLSKYATQSLDQGAQRQNIDYLNQTNRTVLVVSIPLSKSKYLISRLAKDYPSVVENVDLRLLLQPGRALKFSENTPQSLQARLPIELKEELVQSQKLQWPEEFIIKNSADAKYLPSITSAAHETLKAFLKLAKNEETVPDQNDHAFRAQLPQALHYIIIRPTEIITDAQYGIPMQMKLQISVRDTDPMSSKVQQYVVQLIRSRYGGAWTFLYFVRP